MRKVKLPRRVWITFGRQQDCSGFFLNIYRLDRCTHYFGRAGGRFYRRTMAAK